MPDQVTRAALTPGEAVDAAQLARLGLLRAGEGCVIERAEVEHSILLAGSSVRHLDGRMESSLLGRNVRIGRDDRQPRAYRFMVGDNSEIGFP